MNPARDAYGSPCLDKDVQEKLLASLRAYRRRFFELLSSIDLDALKQKASAIRDEATKDAEALWQQAAERLTAAGVDVVFARDNAEARAEIARRVGERRPVVKSKSNLLGELGLSDALEQPVVETDTGDWIVQQMGAVRMHPNAPAAALSAAEIGRFLREQGKLEHDGTPAGIARAIQARIRQQILQAEVGLSGVNFVTAEGHLVIVENEGNISLVTRVPPIHIAVVGYHRIVPSVENAAFLSQCLSMFGTGNRSTAYVNVISGPSYTADIEKAVIRGAQGAHQVHLVVVDNHRRKMLADDKLRKALKCIGCGACLLHCPVFELCGAGFGGLHPGGIGLVLSHHVGQQQLTASHGLYACLGCELCEELCPVDAKIWDNIKSLRNSSPTTLSQRVLSSLRDHGTLHLPPSAGRRT